MRPDDDDSRKEVALGGCCSAFVVLATLTAIFIAWNGLVAR